MMTPQIAAEQLEAFRWVYRAVLLAATLASWATVLTYHFRSHGLWRGSRWGRHLIGSDTMLAIFLTFYMTASFIPDRRWIYGIGIALFIGYIWFRIDRSRLMLESQRVGEAKDAAEAAEAQSVREEHAP